MLKGDPLRLSHHMVHVLKDGFLLLVLVSDFLIHVQVSVEHHIHGLEHILTAFFAWMEERKQVVCLAIRQVADELLL